ncbi:MAG: hypothetical protein QOE69_1629 [Thermoleophilaceae bacterium]|jgi:hypothetical protein|nr:hypothetical protein [Thermoleophilaceae bacterium]
MARGLTVLVAAAFLTVVLPASAGAATGELPVGQADGVRIVREHGAIVVVFTPRAQRLWRRVAGKRVSVMCERGPSEPDEQGFVFTEEGGSTFRVPRRGRRLRTGDGTRGMDICRVWLEPRTVRRNGHRQRFGRELIVAIPLTQRGAVRLDERARAGVLVGVLSVADIYARQRHLDRYLTSEELVAELPLLKRPLRLSVVALGSPSDTPPAGSVGYYSDGARHVAAVILSGSGRRLFLELDVDDVVRTNVAGYIYGDD